MSISLAKDTLSLLLLVCSCDEYLSCNGYVSLLLSVCCSSLATNTLVGERVSIHAQCLVRWSVLHCACCGLGGNAEEWSSSVTPVGCKGDISWSQDRYPPARNTNLAAGSYPEACVRSLWARIPRQPRAFSHGRQGAAHRISSLVASAVAEAVRPLSRDIVCRDWVQHSLSRRRFYLEARCNTIGGNNHAWPCGRPPAAAYAAASPAPWSNGAWRVGAACWSRCLAPGQRQRLPRPCESFNEQNFPKMDSLLAITDDYCFITSSLLVHYFLITASLLPIASDYFH